MLPKWCRYPGTTYKLTPKRALQGTKRTSDGLGLPQIIANLGTRGRSRVRKGTRRTRIALVTDPFVPMLSLIPTVSDFSVRCGGVAGSFEEAGQRQGIFEWLTYVGSRRVVIVP